ncbi:uncharacterized protein LOC118023968 isoform X2 [Mirounga leonina]|uniref:uncharacterized protein LOC118023968 isoform X2 n=1 Tax=Mirounga leonina TaxID=9715 RepID=UPI00156C2768|nr:uncharacterized protein LOC118023968 isoform X2 [Mirounga leonina]
MRSLGLTRALGGGIVIPLTDGKSEAGERWHALVQGFLEESRTQYIVGALKPRSLLDIWRKRMNFFETKLHLGRSVSPAGTKNARSVAVTFTLDSPVPGTVLGTEV